MRAYPGIDDTPTAIITLNRLLPSAATMEIASNMLGMASRMSINRITTLSTMPP